MRPSAKAAFELQQERSRLGITTTFPGMPGLWPPEEFSLCVAIIYINIYTHTHAYSAVTLAIWVPREPPRCRFHPVACSQILGRFPCGRLILPSVVFSTRAREVQHCIFAGCGQSIWGGILNAGPSTCRRDGRNWFMVGNGPPGLGQPLSAWEASCSRSSDAIALPRWLLGLGGATALAREVPPSMKSGEPSAREDVGGKWGK